MSEIKTEQTTDECAMCGADVSACWVSGRNGNKFCRYCYYPTPEQAREKGEPGWHPYKAGERCGGWGTRTSAAVETESGVGDDSH